jgi:YD repeat-containing protein
MFIKSLPTLFLLSFSYYFGYTQGVDKNNYVENILPVSPTASSLTKYIDCPVDYSTGVPSISYNLYTLDIDGLKIPITLSYHAGGIKVDDIGTAVGLGWTLQAGGGIFRQVNGQADEIPTSGFLFNSMTNSNYVNALDTYINDSSAPQTLLQQVAQNYWDFTQDNYSYSILDKSGNFYFNKNKQLTLSEKSNLLIKDSIGSTHIFSAIDDDGNKYSFTPATFSNYYISNTSGGHNKSGVGIADWMISEVSTPKKRKVDFSYNTYETYYSVSLYDLLDVNTATLSGINIPLGGCDETTCQNQPTTLSLVTRYLDHMNMLLQSIVADNINVQFIYSTAPSSNWQMELDSIKISNKNKIVKVIHFNYSVFNGDPRLKLTGFQNINLIDSNNEKYQFNYYDGGARSLPLTTSKAKDMFGYYNGANSNSTLIYSTDPYCAYKANRDIDTFNILNGTLNEIVLPTGGRIDFAFEPNYLGAGTYLPGLRLKKRTVYDNVSNITETENYNYGSGYGVRATNDLSIISETDGQVYYKRIYFNSNNYPIDQFRNGYFAKSGYIYENVTEDKTSASGEDQRATYIYKPFTVGQNVRGYLTNTIIYKQNGGQFTVNKSIGQSYAQTNYDSLTTPNYALGHGLIWTQFQFNNGDIMCCSTIYSGIDSAQSFSQTMIQKTAETDTLFTDAGPVITTQNFYYDNPSHVYLTRGTLYNSDSSFLTTKYKYPMDMISNGLDSTGVYQDMVNRNMVHPLIVTEKYKNSNLLSSTTTQYRSDWYPNKSIIAPSYIDQKNFGQSQGKIWFLQYDSTNGKLLQLAKENDFNRSFIYDYINSFLIASVINASYSDIAASSFEADGHGNFTFTGTPVTDTAAFTGSKDYALSSGAITKTGLTAATSYIISYWSKSGSATVNGATTSTLMSRRGWNYFDHTVSGVTSISISGSVTIDDLRLYPKTAQVTTYTYDPLIGLTSQTSENNRTTYFEYDGLNRLNTIRDEDRNIQKKWNYQYQVAPNGSPTIYQNAPKSQAYKKKNCGGDSTGSSYTYVVPAGTYSSPISQAYVDSLAQADVVANGQNEANANGSCTMLFYNNPIIQTFTRDSCPAGYTPSQVKYYVNPGKYTSLISQAYVDSLAQNEVNTKGQAYADSVGKCVPPVPENVNYGNTTTDQMTITFTNIATNIQYSFLLPHTAGSKVAGQIPSGVYNATIGPSSSNTNTYNFRIGTSQQTSVNSMTVTDITIVAAITILISNPTTP